MDFSSRNTFEGALSRRETASYKAHIIIDNCFSRCYNLLIGQHRKGECRMIYSKAVNDAINLMCEAHSDARDKSGIPYIFHPYHVAEQMTSEDSVIAALLHDVLEDTDLTADDLRARGVPENVVSSLLILNHHEGVPYMDYIRKIKCDPIAREVKIADIRHNLDASRLVGIIPENLVKKRPIYEEALAYLLTE